MNKKKTLTLQDIADELGITKMTVSRYFREPERVAKATRERIANIVETQGFVQNRAPALMSKAISKTIGVVIPSLSNQVFSSLVEGVESITQPAGFDILLAHTGYDPRVEERKVAMLLSYRVDGLILCETTHTPKTINMIKQSGIPVVEAMEIEHVVGVGKYAQQRALKTLSKYDVEIHTVWHPSPASPLANRNGGADWRENVSSVLRLITAV